MTALLDRYLAKTGYDSQQTDAIAAEGRPDNLFVAEDGQLGHDFGASGDFTERSHDRSLQMWASHHARLVAGAVVGAALAGGAAALSAARKSG